MKRGQYWDNTLPDSEYKNKAGSSNMKYNLHTTMERILFPHHVDFFVFSKNL